MKRDTFLNYISADSKVILEDCIAFDLGLPYDCDGKRAEYIVKENYETFFIFYNTEFNGIEIKDLLNNDEHAIVGFIKDSEYNVCSYNFHIRTKNFNGSIEEKWNIINIACALYLKLNVDTSNIIFVN